MSTILRKDVAPASAERTTVATKEETLDEVSTAFGVSAAVTILFNTVLAWVKDAYDPLNSFMASLTGHHWITHGLADVALFFILGWVLMARGTRVSGNRLIASLAAAIVLGGGGLAAWFLFV